MQISWFPPAFIPFAGRLGLTSLPGGHFNTRDEDIANLIDQGVTHLVCLVEADELQRLEPPETIEERRAAVEEGSMSFLHHPIEDFAAPRLEGTLKTVTHISTALEDEAVVVLHCWAGLGRAGTIAACWLVSMGMSAHDAIQTVRWVRPGAIQSQVQEDHIESHARFVRENPP